MSIDHKKYRILELKDLNTFISFGRWVNKSMFPYDKDKVISDNNMLIYLSFIENQIKDQRLENKKEWVDAVKSIKDRVEKKKAE